MVKSIKSSIFSISILTIFGVSLIFSPFAMAENKKIDFSDEKAHKIVSECQKIKGQIGKTRSNDALMRVNLGQSYETISDKLMVNLNTRIASNKLNGSKLVEKTAEFNENVIYFRENYQKYEKELTKLSDMKCSDKDIAKTFYEQLEKVRYLRSELNYNTTKIAEISKEYKDALREFKDGLK